MFIKYILDYRSKGWGQNTFSPTHAAHRLEIAAREILEFVQGVSQAEFERNNQLRNAVERQLMVIGEAARHVSGEFQVQYPKIP